MIPPKKGGPENKGIGTLQKRQRRTLPRKKGRESSGRTPVG